MLIAILIALSLILSLLALAPVWGVSPAERRAAKRRQGWIALIAAGLLALAVAMGARR